MNESDTATNQMKESKTPQHNENDNAATQGPQDTTTRRLEIFLFYTRCNQQQNIHKDKNRTTRNLKQTERLEKPDQLISLNSSPILEREELYSFVLVRPPHTNLSVELDSPCYITNTCTQHVTQATMDTSKYVVIFCLYSVTNGEIPYRGEM